METQEATGRERERKGGGRERERGERAHYCSTGEEVKDMKGERRTLKLCQPFQEMKKGGYATG